MKSTIQDLMKKNKKLSSESIIAIKLSQLLHRMVNFQKHRNIKDKQKHDKIFFIGEDYSTT